MRLSTSYEPEDSQRMQTDLAHLPREKQRDLEKIVTAVRAHLPAEMITLYGSYARGDWKEEKDLPPHRWSGHASDYDILIIVEDEETVRDIKAQRAAEQACKEAELSARVQFIVHDIEDINANLKEGRYFFMDIKREGRLLFDTERFKLAEPEDLTPEQDQKLAQSDFDQWFGRATQFYKGYKFYYDDGDLKTAIFNLNQAAESAYKCILLVFTGYCPHEHLLAWLGEDAALCGPVFRDIFPQETQQEQERFLLLDKAYIGARYHKDFQVFWGDVEYLAPRVKELLAVTEKICREAIKEIGQGD